MSKSGIVLSDFRKPTTQELILQYRIAKIALDYSILDLEFTMLKLNISCEKPSSPYSKEEVNLSIEEKLPDALKTKECFDKAIFLFADMQGFSKLSQEISQSALDDLLNTIYSVFFKIIEAIGAPYGIGIVKLSGDCIMLSACSQDEEKRKEQAIAMGHVALYMSNFLSEFNRNSEIKANFRIGINIGPATKVDIKFKRVDGTYQITEDWYGEGVNKASRMESSGLSGQIQITPEVYAEIKDIFVCSTPCERNIKSYGGTQTLFILHTKKTELEAELTRKFVLPGFRLLSNPQFSLSTPTPNRSKRVPIHEVAKSTSRPSNPN